MQTPSRFARITRPDGQTVNFAYDAAGRLSARTTPDGGTSYAYAPATGKPSSVTTPDGAALSFAYNGALPTQTQWTGTVAGAVGYAYDNDFRVKTITVNGAAPVAYGYDADSLLTVAGGLSLARSPQNGLLTGTTLGAVADTLAHNGFGETQTYTAKINGGPAFAATYDRDALGRITRKTETVQGAAVTYDYAYDPAGRLAEIKRNGAATAAYGYDANGNRTTLNGQAVATYDDQDRLATYNGTTYAYTANGELQSKTQGGQATNYRYDVLGNLRQATLPGGAVVDYLVDGDNRRIGKKVNGVLVQGLLWQDGLKPAAELDGNNAVVSRFVYATRANVPDYLVKGGATYRIIADHLGSPRLVVDAATGAVAQRMDYDEWGKVILDTSPGFQPFGFAGGLHDRDTGLVRFGARDYDPETGRWTAKDPILFGGGDANLYGYVGDSPLNFIDPLGLVGEPEGWPKGYPELPLSDDKLRPFKDNPDALKDMFKRLRNAKNFPEADKVKKCQKEFGIRDNSKQRGQPNMRAYPLHWISVPLTCFLYPEACDRDPDT